eukprot:COSAG04_NODE_29887_length_266_cov_0.610778_1_plen_61_part_10
MLYDTLGYVPRANGPSDRACMVCLVCLESRRDICQPPSPPHTHTTTTTHHHTHTTRPPNPR